MSLRTLKCVVVGDGAVGKTCLLIRYAKGEFPLGYVPTVFDNYAVTIPIAGERYDLHLFDTAGQEEYDQLRKLTFDNTDVFIVCFSVVLWSSFVNIREKWVPELQEYSPGVPLILVGTKTDLRYDQETIERLTIQGKIPISKQQGEKLAKELNAIKYIECSALTKENVNDVFQEAIFVAISGIPKLGTTVITQQPTSFNSSSNNNNFSQKKEVGCCTRCCIYFSNGLSNFCSHINCNC